MLTVRKRIAEALEEETLDLREISRRFKIKEKEALDHLQHVARSAGPGKFVMEPPTCSRCGFSFKKRTRINKPGRCPLCRSESVEPPRFRITR
jgi:transcriptional regulator